MTSQTKELIDFYEKLLLDKSKWNPYYKSWEEWESAIRKIIELIKQTEINKPII